MASVTPLPHRPDWWHSGNGKVSLSWMASAGATNYHVKRGTTSGGPYTQVAARPQHLHRHGLTNNLTYYYVVSALDTQAKARTPHQYRNSGGTAPDVVITIDPSKTKPISPYIYASIFITAFPARRRCSPLTATWQSLDRLQLGDERFERRK